MTYPSGYAEGLLTEYEQYKNTDKDRARQVAEEYKRAIGEDLPGYEPERPKPRPQQRR